MPADGEIAVVGLGKSGVSAAKLLRKEGLRVYVSDISTSDTSREAKDLLETLGAEVTLGVHDLDRIAKAALVVVSPGIPPTAPPLQVARDRPVEVISEIELALRYMRRVPYIAVTGTNGKTTTTALIGHLLRALGHEAVEAGNIGVPLTEVALRDTLPDWIALEVSSFQLHDTPSIDPAVGVLTNLTPDHLDRYPTVEDYYADKARLFANATVMSRWVLNADDPVLAVMTETVPGMRLHFTTAAYGNLAGRGMKADASYDRASGDLTVHGAPLLHRRDLPLLGDHNVANALAASLAVMAASLSHGTVDARAAIAAALRSFHAPPHRLELVGEWGGVQWVNDSKATNVSSTYVAIDGMTRPTILLLGGRHKGEPYTSLADPIRTHVKRVIAYGEAGAQVEHDLRAVVPVDLLGDDFETVMTHARDLAQPGDVVLLSPACSSYDMFKNYEERGVCFRDLARASAS